jgi:hypothetical protein
MRSPIGHTILNGIAIAILFFMYYWIGYELERHQFELLLSLYTAAFALSYYLFKSGINLKTLIILSFGFKAIFLFSIPELSQDFYRFIWDGMLTNNELNPYLYLPTELINNSSFSAEQLRPLLYEKMGDLSTSNYSTYPPLAQLIYSLTYAIAGDSLWFNIVLLRLFNIVAEIGITCLGLRLLSRLQLPKQRILFFIMNPLVILESTFSLHFEVIMLLFIVLSLIYMHKTKIYISALSIGAAILSKLIPLMLIPLFFPYFKSKNNRIQKEQIVKFLRFCLVILLSLVFAYSALWNQDVFLNNANTLSLYFSSFEFNASFYYVLRWIGFQWVGYNMIAILGKSLAFITLGFILYLTFKDKKINLTTLVKHLLWTSTLYYLLATTVHPWYLMLPLLLSVFTTYNYMLVWSYVVMLSYSAYNNPEFNESYLLISIEYIMVYTSIGYAYYKRSKDLRLT